MNDTELKQLADEFARANKRRLAAELTDLSKYAPDITPISVFMAGSPGAGKTEYSKNLVQSLEEKQKNQVIRIDPDDFRKLLPGYDGKNSSVFHFAANLITEAVHDSALRQKQNFLLDGTFSNYEKARFNIARSLDQGRPVFISYVYQKPETAWQFTIAREKEDGRTIPRDAFIRQFLGARETIDKIRKEYADHVTIFLIQKDLETKIAEPFKITQAGPQIDHYIKEQYTQNDLEKLL